MAVDFFAVFELVRCATVGASGLAGFGHFNVDAWMHAPEGALGPGQYTGKSLAVTKTVSWVAAAEMGALLMASPGKLKEISAS